MKLGSRILIGAGCLVLLAISWIIAISAPSDEEKQLLLMEQAAPLLEDEIYVRAEPLLEEAASYHTEHTGEAEEMLKQIYLHLIDQQGYSKKYTTLLQTQMSREGAAPEVFLEAANYYLERSKLSDAFTVLTDGIKKTGSEELVDLYEDNRYTYQMGYNIYEDVTAAYGTTIAVQNDGLWGLSSTGGGPVIPCQYDWISTYSVDRVIVSKDGIISAVDSSGNRVALLKESVSELGNFSNNRIALHIGNEWRYADGEFTISNVSYEQLGTYSNGYAAAKQGGKWGVIDLRNEWLIPPEYDEVIMDELGQACQQGAVFVRRGDSVYLFVDGVQVGDSYEAAKAFGAEGYAAVMKNGSWGFIDVEGQVRIPYQFDDAISFGQHLAAVKTGDFWGYISLSGKLVIEGEFLQAKSFSNGSAPVLTDRGWKFITLAEYSKGVSL